MTALMEGAAVGALTGKDAATVLEKYLETAPRKVHEYSAQPLAAPAKPAQTL